MDDPEDDLDVCPDCCLPDEACMCDDDCDGEEGDAIDSSDSPRMEPYGSREYVVITSGGLTVSLVAECFGWRGNKVEFFIEETIIASFLSPQSIVGKTTEKERGTVLTDPVVKVSTEQLGPLGSVLRDLQMAVKQDTCSEYIRREVMRCCEEFRKVVSP